MADKDKDKALSEEMKESKRKADAEAAEKKAFEAARAAEAEEIKAAKSQELQANQIWDEEEHENPFDSIWRAKVLEVRKNKSKKLYVKFTAYRLDLPDVKEPVASVTEEDFRKRFAKFVS